MVGWVLGTAAFVVLFLVVVAVANHGLRNPGQQSAGVGDAFGNFIDVFDPAQARAQQDLKSHENQGEIIPSPDDDERPMRIIDRRGQRIVMIRRPAVEPPHPSTPPDD
jgi:hypothetical protein